MMTERVCRVDDSTTDPVVECIDQIAALTLLAHDIQTAAKSYTILLTEPSQPVITPFF